MGTTASFRPLRSSVRCPRGTGVSPRVEGSFDWLFESASLPQPGFEVNDLAFLTRADYAWMNVNAFRQWTKPTRRFRQAYWIVGAQQQFNFDGDRNDLQYHNYIEAQFPNYWWISSFWSYRPEVFDDRLTRGGPVVKARPVVRVDEQHTTTQRALVSSLQAQQKSGGLNGYGLYSEIPSSRRRTFRRAPTVL